MSAQNELAKNTKSFECIKIVYYLTALMMSAGGSLWHHKTKGVIAINVPLLCDYFEHYFAAFLHRWA